MGYYNGKGVVTGGSESINPFNSISFNDQNGYLHYYFLEQQVIQSTKVSKGVSLETAKGVHANISMSEKVLSYWWRNSSGQGGEMIWVIPSCKGTKKDVAYTQIADSNLYELSETDVTQKIRVKYDNNGWAGWEQ